MTNQLSNSVTSKIEDIIYMHELYSSERDELREAILELVKQVQKETLAGRLETNGDPVYKVGDWVLFDMPGFTGCKGQIVEIDDNPETRMPYRVRHVSGSSGYFFWCGKGTAYCITRKL